MVSFVWLSSWLKARNAERRGNLDRVWRGKPTPPISAGPPSQHQSGLTPAGSHVDFTVPVGRGPRWCANLACLHHHEDHVAGVCKVPGCTCLNVSVARW